MITEPGPFDTEVEQGATYEKTFYVEVANLPFDFSGYTFAGAIKLRPEDEDQILTLTNSNFTAGAPGYVTVYISKDVTATLPVKKLSWSMRCIQPDTKEFPTISTTTDSVIEITLASGSTTNTYFVTNATIEMMN